MKIEKIRDYDGNIDGYRLGEYILFKDFYCGNYFAWVIAKVDRIPYHDEVSELCREGKVVFANSCKEGKEKLKYLYETR